MATYHINKVLNSMKDIQRPWMFKVVITPPSAVPSAPAFADTGIIFVLTRGVQLPGRTNTPIDSYFGAMKQKFPGKEEFNGQFSLNLEESENLDGIRAMYEWKQLVFNVNSGVSTGLKKSDLIGSATVQFLDFQEAAHPAYVKIHNIWPQDMPDISLEYSASDSLKNSYNFAYDYWTLEGDSGQFSPGAKFE